ncbi:MULTISPECIES: tautomerase family protein [Pseudomonas]|uniref:2-hydroxymuconate tautomerase n=1 Tax=Pseudomonas alkylphenolica TaxID=237609 RepID=A0A443ZW79_9PSED|nr:4-oxalocrotonate tautomerase [Pseudomonas umsongensis]RWU25025.1 4-oxalocrotonate tautomerase [Pseudomonas alkylphenolica]
MPIITINIVEGETSIEEKRLMMLAVTEAISATTSYRPQDVRIIIHELEASNYSVAGKATGAH